MSSYSNLPAFAALAAITLLAAPRASARPNPLLGCAGAPIHATLEELHRNLSKTENGTYTGGPKYNNQTCACLQKKLGWHLAIWIGQDGCVFQTPPNSFDPSHASDSELEAWGIPPADAELLGNAKLRRAYFFHVKHYLSGEGCDKSGCYPSTGSGLEGHDDGGIICGAPDDDGKITRIPVGQLSHYCRRDE